MFAGVLIFKIALHLLPPGAVFHSAGFIVLQLYI